MRDPDIHSFTVETEVFWVAYPDGVVINISMHSAQQFESLQAICHLKAPNIACMPHFIAFRKVLKNTFVQIAVGVGEQAYAFHSLHSCHADEANDKG